jgi:pilus assembly protein CpaB
MGRLRGFLWLIAGLVVALLAGVVAFVTLARATAKAAAQPQVNAPVPVVVAMRAVSARSALAAEDLGLKELPADSVPEGALRRVEEALGKVTLMDLYAGEVILSQRLVDPNIAPQEGRMALVVAEDQVLMAFPAQDLMSMVGVLKPGDHVDLLFSLIFSPPEGTSGTGQRGGQQATFNVLQNATIAAIVQAPKAAGGSQGRPLEAILLAVSPQDALILKYLKDAGGIVDIVLRAPGVERTFPVEPVDAAYITNRYRIRLFGE